MDVLYHITLRTSAALEQQREEFFQGDLFDLGTDNGVKRNGEEVFDQDVDASCEDKESDTADNATDKMDAH